MKTFTVIICILLLSIISIPDTCAQDVYTIFSGEMIFQSGIIEQNDDQVNTNLRFSAWFHAGEYIHLDFGNNIGFFTGLALRNVGFITEENDVKIKYRSYNLGVPLALKLGSFRDGVYVFAGAEYEWMVHFKQKIIIDDEKTKYRSWFSNRTPAFIPSVFGGIQLPKGIHLKFKYYLDNFLNHKFQGEGEYYDYTGFTNTRIWYISLSFQLRNGMVNPISVNNTQISAMR